MAVLPFDGAGLSVTLLPHRRMPLGASSPAAEEAERLQFALAIGPCTAAQRAHGPIHASHADLQAHWPTYTAELACRTPYRSNLALPVGGPLTGAVIMDLYSANPALPEMTTMDAVTTVASLVGDQLARNWVDGDDEPILGLPSYLSAPRTAPRRTVWDALARIADQHQIDSRTALALLRARAFADHTDLEVTAASVLAGHFD